MKCLQDFWKFVNDATFFLYALTSSGSAPLTTDRMQEYQNSRCVYMHKIELFP